VEPRFVWKVANPCGTLLRVVKCMRGGSMFRMVPGKLILYFVQTLTVTLARSASHVATLCRYDRFPNLNSRQL